MKPFTREGRLGEFIIRLSLPSIYDVDGAMWDAWRDSTAKRDLSKAAMTHVYFYCGIEFAQQFGSISIERVELDEDGKPVVDKKGNWTVTEVDMATISGWEHGRSNHEVRLILVTGLGKIFEEYMAGLINPFVVPLN